MSRLRFALRLWRDKKLGYTWRHAWYAAKRGNSYASHSRFPDVLRRLRGAERGDVGDERR